MSISDYFYNKHTSSFDDRLIDLIRVHPAIYDVRNMNYKRNSVRQEIWHKIARTLGASSKTCQVKWKNIRYNYLQEVKNPKNPHIRRRRTTRDLSFLKSATLVTPDIDDADSSSYIYRAEDQQDAFQIVMVDKSETESCAETPSTCIPDEEIDIKPILLAPITEVTEVSASDEADPPSINDSLSTNDAVATSSVPEPTYIPNKQPDDRTPDSVEMYCLSLADTLRAMNRRERERVKFEFASILKDATFKDDS